MLKLRKYFIRNSDKSTPLFTLDGKNKIAKVVDIYDGDTIKCVFNTHHKTYKFNCRLYGIDTPELKPPKAMNNREVEIEKAKKAKQYVINFCEQHNYFIFIKCGKFDKYGRLLIDIFSPNKKENLNQMLIRDGHAVEYFGGTKKQL